MKPLMQKLFLSYIGRIVKFLFRECEYYDIRIVGDKGIGKYQTSINRRMSND